MKIVELFRAVQGEGKTQGVNSLFIRFPGCLCSCKLCDSKYALGNEEVKDFTGDMRESIKRSQNVVFTGGEPFLPVNMENLTNIMDNCSSNPSYEIETNGTILLKDNYYSYFKGNYRKILFNISPKTNVEQDRECELEPIFIVQAKQLCKENSSLDYIVKFLFSSDKDIQHIKHMQQKYYLDPYRIWCQPVGTNSTILKCLINDYFQTIIDNGWNISLRSHIFLFDNKRGV